MREWRPGCAGSPAGPILRADVNASRTHGSIFFPCDTDQQRLRLEAGWHEP
jgi:hypothetical protein